MITYKDYVAGWLGLSLSDLLDGFPRSYERLTYCLIGCIDSNKNPVSLLQISPELEPLRPSARTLGQGLLVPTEALLTACSHSPIFFGFDELWFFPDAPSEPKPEAAWLVGPARVDASTLQTLGPWMTSNSCTLALGSGSGLNFVVKARGVVKYLLGFSRDQATSEEILHSLEYE